MITVRTTQSADMAGRAMFETWRDRWEADFFSPVVADMMRATLTNLPPAQIEKLRAAGPETFESVVQRIGLKQGGV